MKLSNGAPHISFILAPVTNEKRNINKRGQKQIQIRYCMLYESNAILNRHRRQKHIKKINNKGISCVNISKKNRKGFFMCLAKLIMDCSLTPLRLSAYVIEMQSCFISQIILGVTIIKKTTNAMYGAVLEKVFRAILLESRNSSIAPNKMILEYFVINASPAKKPVNIHF